jgi:hypothetical protein
VAHRLDITSGWPPGSPNVVCVGQNMATTTRSGERYYSCPTQPTGCGRIHVRAARLEAWLLDRLVEQLRLEPPPAAQDVDPGEHRQGDG